MQNIIMAISVVFSVLEIICLSVDIYLFYYKKKKRQALCAMAFALLSGAISLGL